jgi:aminoglycoside phosphotransferase (APT) family kinase protein
MALQERMQMDQKQTPSADWIATIRARFPTERTIDEALTRKLRSRAGPPYVPSPMADVENQLRQFAAAVAPGMRVAKVEPLGGGASKEQYRFDLVDGSGAIATYVLRREPPESIVETHRVREYQMMRAMAGVVPVPEVPWVDADGTWFGRPSLISRFVTGLGATYGPALRRELGTQFVDCFARIHRFDWRNSKLDAFDQPTEGKADGVQSVINWWHRVWEEDSFEAMPVIRLAAQWLRANAPPIERVTVVHHDYRAGNFLFDPVSNQFTAILDWELSHLGDYHEDLAWTLQEGYGYRDAEGRFMVCGLIDRSEFLDRYQTQTGFRVEESKLAYYGIMNTWKSAIIVLGTGIRCAIGGKSHQDILLTWLAGFGHVCVDSLNRQLKAATHGS